MLKGMIKKLLRRKSLKCSIYLWGTLSNTIQRNSCKAEDAFTQHFFITFCQVLSMKRELPRNNYKAIKFHEKLLYRL